MTHLVSIGRFAQLARLTPRALRLYDDLGLLVPARVDPASGYRLYSLGQVATANAIRTLRELDVPLEEIRAYLHADEAGARAVLEAHRERLGRELAVAWSRLAELGRLLQEVPVEYSVSLRSEPSRPVVYIGEEVTLPETAGVLRAAMDEVCAWLGRRGVDGAGAPWYAYPVPEEGEAVPVDCVVPVAAPVEGEGRVRSARVPAGEVAYTRHVGPYSALPVAFEAVARWVGERGLDIAGPIREVYLEHDPGPAGRHVVEVVFPVTRRVGEDPVGG